MKISIAAIAVPLICILNSAEAEIRVETQNGDLLITTEQSSDWDDFMTEYQQGFHFDVTEVDGMVQVRSSNDVTVNGRQSRLFPFPNDDIILSASASTQGGIHFAVHSLSMSGRSDDLRISTSGSCHVVNVSTGNKSHSDLRINASGSVEVKQVWVQRDMRIDSSYNFDMELTGVGDLSFISCRGDATFVNNWMGGNFSLYFGGLSNIATFSEYLQIDGNTYIQLAGGSDFVEIDLSPFSTFGSAWLEGGSGTDTVYQNALFFTAGNTKSIEYFK